MPSAGFEEYIFLKVLGKFIIFKLVIACPDYSALIEMTLPSFCSTTASSGVFTGTWSR
jgi:hypothetical protein